MKTFDEFLTAVFVGGTVVLLLANAIAGTIVSAKTVEKSCPICGRCEPREYMDGVGFYACRGITGTMFKYWLNDGEIIYDTIKWVPRDTMLAHVLDGILPIGDDRLVTPLKRKCVDEIRSHWILDGKDYWGESLRFGRADEGRTINSVRVMSDKDTAWCDCDGDTAYWEMVIRDGMWSDSITSMAVYGRYKEDTIYTRIPDRWRKETKTTWVKKKKTVKDVWE